MPHHLLCFITCLLLTGCLVSEKPFYLEEQTYKDARIEGAFTNTFNGDPVRRTKWFIQPHQPNGPGNWTNYKITVTEGDVKNVMLGTLFKINEQSYLDLFPLTDSGVNKVAASVSPSEYIRAALYKPRHTIWKVEIDDEGVAYSFPIGKGLGAAARAFPELADGHEKRTKMVEMTKTIEENQKIIAGLADVEGVYTGQGKLLRASK